MDDLLEAPTNTFIRIAEVWVPEGDRLVLATGTYDGLEGRIRELEVKKASLKQQDPAHLSQALDVHDPTCSSCILRVNIEMNCTRLKTK